MACCSAAARPRPGEVLSAAKVPVVNPTAASEKTGQCDTSSARLPAKKNALARPESPSAWGEPSSAAVLQADKMPQSALSLISATSDAVSKPSSCGPTS